MPIQLSNPPGSKPPATPVPGYEAGLDVPASRRPLFWRLLRHQAVAYTNPNQWVIERVDGSEIGIMRRGQGMGWKVFLKRALTSPVRHSEIASIAEVIGMRFWNIVQEEKTDSHHYIVAESQVVKADPQVATSNSCPRP
ncbi:MAG: hypothetical protein H5T84_07350 [Thermoleophilia bacterium]|nr:hypothetical protein [Thermoleophilia bacterium]